MTISEFTRKIADVLEISDELTPETNLKDFEEYDSMAIMTLIAFLHKTFDQKFTARQLNQVDSVSALIDLVGRDRFTV